jgi:GntR family transcriptional repressor for pyruvate dehydrogenase complex
MDGDAFEPVPRERLSDRVAAQVLRLIREGTIREGDLLPTEQDMSRRFDVSRTVVREAVRSLVGKGVIQFGPGKRLRVGSIDAEQARESLSLFIQGANDIDLTHVHEVRVAIEDHLSGLAAERATPADLMLMERANETMRRNVDDVDVSSQADLEFHRVVARSTQNQLFVVMLDAIAEPLLQVRLLTFGPHGHTRTALASHEAILKAISLHDSAGARAAMSAHLEDVRQFVTDHRLLPPQSNAGPYAAAHVAVDAPETSSLAVVSPGRG